MNQRLKSWGGQHLYSALSSLGRLWQRRGATLLTVLVMGLALALPLLLHLAVRNVEHFGGSLEEARELSVFFRPDAAKPDVDGLREALRQVDGVANVELRSPDDGLAELKQLPGFADAMDLLDANPLPPVLLVAPHETAKREAIEAIAATARAAPGVDFVQYDLEWRERLTRALAVAKRLVLVVGALLALGALLVVGNTIRLDVQGRADEIAIVQQLGGSKGFVRRPFLYAGCWYGLMAGLLALACVVAAQLALAQPVAELAASYGSELALRGLDARSVLAAMAAGIMLGWLGAWAACGRHLARGGPR